jgi:hypothetical protein
MFVLSLPVVHIAGDAVGHPHDEEGKEDGRVE